MIIKESKAGNEIRVKLKESKMKKRKEDRK
jgi:hypothetical protein